MFLWWWHSIIHNVDFEYKAKNDLMHHTSMHNTDEIEGLGVGIVNHEDQVWDRYKEQVPDFPLLHLASEYYFCC